MQLEQASHRGGPPAGKAIALILLDGLARCQAGGPADVILFIPVDLRGQQFVCLGMVADSFETKKGGKAFLPEVKLPFDLALGLRVFGDEVTHSETSQGSLKLGQGVGVTGFARLVAEEAEAIGIEVVGQSVSLKNPPDVIKVSEGGFGLDKASSHDAACRIIDSQGEDLELVARPPLMGGAVMLKQVTVSLSLPPSPRFWSAIEWFPEEMCHVLEDMISNVGDRA